MKPLTNFLQVLKPKAHSERAELLGELFIYLESEWRGLKPLTIKYLAFRTSHLEVKDLRYLLSISRDSRNFGKTFWGALKPRV